mgnify:CR=1 FL=1
MVTNWGMAVHHPMDGVILNFLQVCVAMAWVQFAQVVERGNGPASFYRPPMAWITIVAATTAS